MVTYFKIIFPNDNREALHFCLICSQWANTSENHTGSVIYQAAELQYKLTSQLVRVSSFWVECWLGKRGTLNTEMESCGQFDKSGEPSALSSHGVAWSKSKHCWSCFYNKFWYFVQHEVFALTFFKYYVKVGFILMSEFSGVLLNCVPKAHASL